MIRALALCIILTANALAPASDLCADAGGDPPLEWFFDAVSLDEAEAAAALSRLASQWQDRYAALIVDLARFTQLPQPTRTADVSGLLPRQDPQGLTHMPQYAGAQFVTLDAAREHPTTRIRARLIRFLQQRTGKRFSDLDAWRAWAWSTGGEPHAQYLAFKAELYERLDPRMGLYFSPGRAATIRLDEIEWTGARANEFPPLFNPAYRSAAEARDLSPGERLVSLSVGGEARAYPVRMLARHQIVHDRLGGRDVIVAHCPIGGVFAAFDAEIDGSALRFGTSGLAYRSASLLFDERTRSLWSIVSGRALVRTFAEQRASLMPLPIVMTTWADWRAAHPSTTALSLDTGYGFTYTEPAITRAALERTGLGFPVPHSSRLLPAQADVLGLVVGFGDAARAVAIPIKALAKGTARTFSIDRQQLLVMMSRAGAARVYGGDVLFPPQPAGAVVRDQRGRRFLVSEDAVRLEGDETARLVRLPVVQVSWRTWYADRPDTFLAR